MKARTRVMVGVLVFTVLVWGAAVGSALWTFHRGGGTGDLLQAAFLALLVAAVVGCGGTWLLWRHFDASIATLRRMVEAFQRGNLRHDAGLSPSSPLRDLSDEMRKLGSHLLEKDRAERQARLRAIREGIREALGRFGRGMAQEVQAPLSGVAGFLEMVLRQTGLSPQTQDFLRLADREARSGRESLDRILRFIREDPFVVEVQDLNAFVSETVRAILGDASKEKIQFKLSLHSDRLQAAINREQLRFVLTALVRNSLEAVQPGGGILEVATNRDQEGQVTLLVKDNGRGMNEAAVQKIATPYFTHKKQAKGAGLSLAIADNIVRLHGGTLDFWSQEGEGTVVFLRLPPA